MTVLLEIVDDDHLTRLNRHQKPPRRGWALRGGALYKDGRLLGGVTELPYVMKPRSTDLVVELRYTPIRELLNSGESNTSSIESGALQRSGPAALTRPGPGTEGEASDAVE